MSYLEEILIDNSITAIVLNSTLLVGSDLFMCSAIMQYNPFSNLRSLTYSSIKNDADICYVKLICEPVDDSSGIRHYLIKQVKIKSDYLSPEDISSYGSNKKVMIVTNAKTVFQCRPIRDVNGIDSKGYKVRCLK